MLGRLQRVTLVRALRTRSGGGLCAALRGGGSAATPSSRRRNHPPSRCEAAPRGGRCVGGPPCAPRLLSDTARLQDAPCRGVGRLRCAQWPRSGGRGPSEPVRNRHVIRLVTDTTQGAGKRERGPQSRATSSAVRRGRARRGALHPHLLQPGSPSATRSRGFGFLTFLPRHSIIVFPCRRKLFLNIIVAGVSAAHRALGPALGLNLDVDVAPGPGTSQGPRRAVVPVPADGAGRAGRAHGPTARDGGGRAEHSCGGEGGLAVSGDPPPP